MTLSKMDLIINSISLSNTISMFVRNRGQIIGCLKEANRELASLTRLPPKSSTDTQLHPDIIRELRYFRQVLLPPVRH